MTEIDRHIKILLDKKDLQNPNSFEELGYIYFGPLVFNYFAWLITDLKNIDKVLFNSREGYFLKKIYDIFKNKYELPESVYFKTSRKISAIAAFFTREDIYKTFELHRYCGKLSNMLENRFGISKNIKNDYYIDTTKEIPNLDEYVDDILESAKNTRNEYKKYILNIIEDSKKLLMVDSGYQGMTQYNIQKAFDIECIGRYFIYKGNTNLKNVKGFYDFEKSDLRKNLIFFESVFIEQHGSYINIKDGKFINEIVDNDLQFFEEKNKIVNGIIKFVNDMNDFNIDIKNQSYEYSNYIFNLMCTKDYIKNNSLFDIFFHDNYYVRDSVKKITR